MKRSSGRALVAGVTASASGAIVLACIVSACSASGAVPDPEAQTAATPQRAAAITPAVATWADPTREACGGPLTSPCLFGPCTVAEPMWRSTTAPLIVQQETGPWTASIPVLATA